LRIYDTNEVYRDRQMKAAKKLAEFVRFSPIFAQIIRKAQSQTLSARNPAAFKTFLLEANAARPRCFIATAAFDNPHAWQVQTLCYLRDERLLKTKSGRAFVALYYRFSPTVAAWLDRHANAKPPVRWLLSLLASQIRAAKSLESPPMNAPFLPNGAKQRNSTQQSVSNLS
jgi:hypothetical protein